jgi:hypothetical protein
MIETNDHCLRAFDARNDPAALAAEMTRYPKLVKPKKEAAASTAKRQKPTDEQRAAKRRAKRAAEKESTDRGIE